MCSGVVIPMMRVTEDGAFMGPSCELLELLGGKSTENHPEMSTISVATVDACGLTTWKFYPAPSTCVVPVVYKTGSVNAVTRSWEMVDAVGLVRI